MWEDGRWMGSDGWERVGGVEVVVMLTLGSCIWGMDVSWGVRGVVLGLEWAGGVAVERWGEAGWIDVGR